LFTDIRFNGTGPFLGKDQKSLKAGFSNSLVCQNTLKLHTLEIPLQSTHTDPKSLAAATEAHLHKYVHD
jgi:hypothetical protein